MRTFNGHILSRIFRPNEIFKEEFKGGRNFQSSKAPQGQEDVVKRDGGSTA